MSAVGICGINLNDAIIHTQDKLCRRQPISDSCSLTAAHHQGPTIDGARFLFREQLKISNTNGMSSMFASHNLITGGTFTQVQGDAHYHGFRGAILLRKISPCETHDF
jgi:hypothetical protein